MASEFARTALSPDNTLAYQHTDGPTHADEQHRILPEMSQPLHELNFSFSLIPWHETRSNVRLIYGRTSGPVSTVTLLLWSIGNVSGPVIMSDPVIKYQGRWSSP
jgi:hypothetical protein